MGEESELSQSRIVSRPSAPTRTLTSPIPYLTMSLHLPHRPLPSHLLPSLALLSRPLLSSPFAFPPLPSSPSHPLTFPKTSAASYTRPSLTPQSALVRMGAEEIQQAALEFEQQSAHLMSSGVMAGVSPRSPCPLTSDICPLPYACCRILCVNGWLHCVSTASCPVLKVSCQLPSAVCRLSAVLLYCVPAANCPLL